MKLPQTLYVKVEKGTGGGADYFVADSEIDALVEMGGKTKIGVYKLIETRIARAVVHAAKVRR